MNIVLVVLLGMHVIGDFYLQPDAIAGQKRTRYRGILLHALLYAIPFLPLLLVSGWFPFALLVGSHLLVDTLKFPFALKAYKPEWVFVVDQGLHVAMLVWVSRFVTMEVAVVDTYGGHIRIAVYALMILKPVSVMFQVLFSRFRPALPLSGIEGAGETIGYLERLVLAILLVINQVAAIGWVIAAKAFARSRQLSESAEFCEYFLVGTLVSVLSVIVLHQVLFVV